MSGGNGNDLLFGDFVPEYYLDSDAAADLESQGSTPGDDMLIGGAGDDQLFGQEGDDTLEGGEGCDTFFFAEGWGRDVITDFTDHDTIDLTLMDTSFGELSITATNDAVVVDFGNDDTLTVNGVTELTEDDFSF